MKWIFITNKNSWANKLNCSILLGLCASTAITNTFEPKIFFDILTSHLSATAPFNLLSCRARSLSLSPSLLLALVQQATRCVYCSTIQLIPFSLSLSLTQTHTHTRTCTIDTAQLPTVCAVRAVNFMTVRLQYNCIFDDFRESEKERKR